MSESKKRELQHTLMDLKEQEEILSNYIQSELSNKGMSEFLEKNPRATEIWAQLLQVTELKLEVISKLDYI